MEAFAFLKSQGKINLLEFTFQIQLKSYFGTSSRIPLTQYQNILNVIFIFIVEKQQGRITLEIERKGQTIFFGNPFSLLKYNLVFRTSLDFHAYHIILSCT